MTSYDTEEDEDDELVYETDFFLSQPTPSTNLYLLQYPLRTNFVPVGTERPIQGVSIRPRHGRVEVRLGMLGPSNAMDGEEEEEKVTDESLRNIGRTQILRSQPASARPHANYTVSYVVDGALVVIPLKSILQLRPTFDYIDRSVIAMANSKQQQQQPNNNNNDNNTLEPTTVNVAIRKRESERSATRRRNSHVSQVKREAEEAWIKLDYSTVSNCEEVYDYKMFNPASVRAGLTKSEIVPASIAKIEEVAPATKVSTSSYLELYEAHTRSSKIGNSVNQFEPLSVKSYISMSPSVAISTFLSHARLVKFSDVLNITSEAVDTKEVFSALQSTAFLLRGCWVSKKATGLTKMPTNSINMAAGSSSMGKQSRENRRLGEKLNAARHLILNMFRYNRRVIFEKIPDMVKIFLTGARIAQILGEVAVSLEKQPGVWEFKLDDDEQFIEFFKGSLVKDQTIDWNKRVTNATKVMSEHAIKPPKEKKNQAKSSSRGGRSSKGTTRGGGKSNRKKS